MRNTEIYFGTTPSFRPGGSYHLDGLSHLQIVGVWVNPLVDHGDSPVHKKPEYLIGEYHARTPTCCKDFSEAAKAARPNLLDGMDEV
ncbi:MAG: hypothetical protein ACE5I1_22335 [bacterium]